MLEACPQWHLLNFLNCSFIGNTLSLISFSWPFLISLSKTVILETRFFFLLVKYSLQYHWHLLPEVSFFGWIMFAWFYFYIFFFVLILIFSDLLGWNSFRFLWWVIWGSRYFPPWYTNPGILVYFAIVSLISNCLHEIVFLCLGLIGRIYIMLCWSLWSIIPVDLARVIALCQLRPLCEVSTLCRFVSIVKSEFLKS